MSVVMAATRRRGRRRRARDRTPAPARGLHAREVIPPHEVVTRPEIVQIVPGINAGIVAVGKFRPDCVMSHRLDLGDGHVALAYLQRFLPWTVTPHLRRR